MQCVVMGLGYGRRSKTYKLLVCRKDAHPINKFRGVHRISGGPTHRIRGGYGPGATRASTPTAQRHNTHRRGLRVRALVFLSARSNSASGVSPPDASTSSLSVSVLSRRRRHLGPPLLSLKFGCPGPRPRLSGSLRAGAAALRQARSAGAASGGSLAREIAESETRSRPFGSTQDAGGKEAMAGRAADAQEANELIASNRTTKVALGVEICQLRHCIAFTTQKAQRPLGLDLRPDRGRPTLMVGGPLEGGGHGSEHEVALSIHPTYTQTLDRSRGLALRRREAPPLPSSPFPAKAGGALKDVGTYCAEQRHLHLLRPSLPVRRTSPTNPPWHQQSHPTPLHATMETPLRTVLSEGVDGQIKQKSLYMDGTIYLLHLEKSAILAFDVDDETSELIEMSGRPCMVTIDGCCLALWLLTADHQWDRKCVILDESNKYCDSISGVWDCGGVLKTIYKADLPGELTVQRSIIGEVSQDLERRRNSSAHIAEVINPLREEATLNTVCLMEFLVRIMQKLPNGMRDVRPDGEVASVSATTRLFMDQVAPQWLVSPTWAGHSMWRVGILAA
nr:unnamed protein product [Digitaria exilis]